jgi:hypothetical protein
VADDTVKDALSRDHLALVDSAQVRRYFAKFKRITGLMALVTSEVENDGRLNRTEARLLGKYLTRLGDTFAALSDKYLMTGRAPGAPGLVFDRHESGFPIAQELMTMAVDAQQAEKHLAGMASEAELKDKMIRRILQDMAAPVDLQFAMAERLYYQALVQGKLFWTRNDPDAQWIEDKGERRHYLVHWAVYDTQVNLPVVYLMNLEDSGDRPLPNDEDRWPQARAHLMAQSLAGLKLLTVATGFDKDFPDLHPKRLRRIHLGPMYSHDFTLQSGPISDVLASAQAPDGEDWALVWTVEDLVSEREEEVKDGWFSTVERQIFALDPFSVAGADTGTTRTERMVILPERPYQALAELNPPGFRSVRKFVVGAGDRIIPA